jgi:hypothetical protein
MKCPLFNEHMQATQAARALYRVRYCNGDHHECARHIVYLSLGREGVPPDLYPNDRLRAIKLVRLGRQESRDLLQI